MKRHDEFRGRYTAFHLPDIEKCAYESSSGSYICKKENSSLELEEEEDIWGELENFFRIKIYNILDEEAKKLLTEILHWIERQDIYGTALLISLHWEEIEVLFKESGCQDKIVELIMDLRFPKE